MFTVHSGDVTFCAADERGVDTALASRLVNDVRAGRLQVAVAGARLFAGRLVGATIHADGLEIIVAPLSVESVRSTRVVDMLRVHIERRRFSAEVAAVWKVAEIVFVHDAFVRYIFVRRSDNEWTRVNYHTAAASIVELQDIPAKWRGGEA